MITDTQSGRIRSIAAAGDYIVFVTAGMNTVRFQCIKPDAFTVGSLVLKAQVLIGPGTWAAHPDGAVTVPSDGTLTTVVNVVSPMMRVIVDTAGTSGPLDVFMFGQTAV